MFGIHFKKFSPLANITKERVGIELASDNFKIVHLKMAPNKKELANIVSKNTTGLSDEDIAKLIRNSFLELKAKSPQIITTIPSNIAITKNIEMPSTDPAEIKEIISLQAGRHTPYPREEIIIDYIDIGTYKHNYTKILLIIVPRNVVKRQLEIFHKAALKSERVFFVPEGLGWFLKRIFKIETQDCPVNIIHINEVSTDFAVVFRDKVIFFRSIPMGAQQLLEEAGKYQPRFIDEIKRSLEAYQSEDIEKNPNLFILTGAVEEIKGLESILNENLHFPVKNLSYLRNLALSQEALKAVGAVRKISFLSLISLLLACDDLKINLLPDEVKLSRALEERGKELIKTGIFFLIIFVLVFLILITKIYFGSAYLKKLDLKYNPLGEQVERLERDFSRVGLIKNYLTKRGYPLVALTELYELTPPDLQITDIKLDAKGKFSVRGVADTMSTVFSFVEKMEKSKYFKDSRTKYTTKRREGAKDVTDFEVVSTISMAEG